MTAKKRPAGRRTRRKATPPAVSAPAPAAEYDDDGPTSDYAPRQQDLPYYRGDELPEEELSYLWYPYLPLRCCTALYGPLGRGKSTLARALVAAITRGFPLPGGGHTKPADAFWLCSEENAKTVVRPRLAALGADLRRVHFPQEMRDGSRRRIMMPDHRGQLQQMIERAGARVLVFDPIKAFVGGESAADSGTAARAVVDSLTEVNGATNSASLLLLHPRKGGRGGADEQIAGNLEWMNCPRSALLVAEYPDNPLFRVLVHQKSSFGPPGPSLRFQIVDRDGLPHIAWMGAALTTAKEALEDQGSAAERDVLADARAFLRDRLDAEERRTKDLEKWAEDAGIRPMTLRRAKTLEGITSHPVGNNDDRYWVWRKPEEGWR